MRPIDTIILHCSATPPDMDIGAAEIDIWHKGRGWKRIGYHFVIRRNGTVERGRPLAQIGAHVEGHNRRTIGICLVGGVRDHGAHPPAENNFTPAQWAALRALVVDLLGHFPKAGVIGHHDVEPHKACPSFDVRAWLIREHIPAANAAR